jgi:hypothetical protein
VHTPEGGLTAWTVKETLFLRGDDDMLKLWFCNKKTWLFEDWSDEVPKMNDDCNDVNEVAIAMVDNCNCYYYFIVGVI